MSQGNYWADIPPPKRPARKDIPHPGRQPVTPQPREGIPMQNQNQNPPNYQYQQYPPQQQPPQQEYYDESQMPLHLRRGAQFQRNAPRMPQTPQQQIPDNMQKRYQDIERHYHDNPQTTEPAPKHSRINLFAVVTAVFFGAAVLGIIGAVMNFVYSRGNANLATSVSFLHAELAVLFIVMILFYISSIIRK